ncbi:KAP family P-loop NTPase fold protein [Clostridium intestinale]|uniref:KAP family P-loop domain-containing protein n=1 Tax=Clostridium intestinale DSM 6191 TaxID=1121320 RepID=A0A1M5TD68_9CLOT|nr:P-loop NTPase fold protein [Clostridium intestinale]SHH48626.1 KAP family P-loop domain-containing protein [Clostridium intestinale DSM 6191]
MERRVYQNRPHELDEVNDLFGTYYKAKSILNVLDNTNNYLENNNIIALYGAWGSGKTTVMDYISKNTKKYKCIKFEAWRYENDVELALSLFEAIVNEIEKEVRDFNKFIKEVKLSAKTLFCFGKNMILNTEINVFGVKIPIGKSGKDTINEMGDSVKKTSYYSAVNKFNSTFKKLLEDYSKKLNKRIIIFIDDLDRCEPSKVLDLLSAIKHFFSESKDVVYFCAIDKNSVNQSINVRYKNVITAEEYLEKIFDISFSMPEECYLYPIVRDFYVRMYKEDEVNESEVKLVNNFLKHINFTNPRKIKKVFNKYIMLNDLYDSMSEAGSDISFLYNMSRKDVFNVIMILYIIILFEFYREIFNDLLEYKTKFSMKIDMERNPLYITLNNEDINLIEFVDDKNLTKRFAYLEDFCAEELLSDKRRKNLVTFILIFYPNDLDKIYLPRYINNNPFDDFYVYREDTMNNIKEVTNNIQKSNIKILSKFLSFIINKLVISEERVKEPINIVKIITMAKMYL